MLEYNVWVAELAWSNLVQASGSAAGNLGMQSLDGLTWLVCTRAAKGSSGKQRQGTVSWATLVWASLSLVSTGNP